MVRPNGEPGAGYFLSTARGLTTIAVDPDASPIRSDVDMARQNDHHVARMLIYVTRRISGHSHARHHH